MSDTLDIAPGETHVVRLFRLDMSPEQVRFLRDDPAALADILGLDQIDPAHADIIRLDDLEELGLSGYLVDGIGVDAAEIASDRARLDAMEGHVLVLLSRALGDSVTRLTPGSGVTLVATYRQVATDWSAKPMQSDSARPGSGTRAAPRKERARSRRIGGAIFAAVMVVLVLIILAVIW